MWNCPYCNTELTDDDAKVLSHITSTILKLTNPFRLAKGLYDVGKTIYYDFSDIPQTDEYLYCPSCKVYFIRCCYCGHLNCVGSDIMISPKKIICNKCNKEYVYATHPDPDADHGI